MPSPSLLIRRLVVEGELSCDISFSYGLNIVQAFSEDPTATNNAGKSTLVELIQYGLGKEQKSKVDWCLSPIIDQVDNLYLEIQLNNKIFTIERSLHRLTAAATIRHGLYTSDIKNISGQKILIKEMSKWLLTALNIPEVGVSTPKGNFERLSFPLLMRAIILNQRLSFSAILNKVMPEDRISEIIGFLTGIIPIERFTLQEALATNLKELQTLKTYFASINQFFMENSDKSFDNVDDYLNKVEKDLEVAKETQLLIQKEIRGQVQSQSRDRAGRINHLQKQLLDLKEEIAGLERSLVGVVQEQNRLKELLNSLKVDRKKVQRLKTSSFILNSVDFSACPRCLQPITSEMKAKEEYGRCALCSRPMITTSDSIPKLIPRTEDIDSQIEEVKTVLSDISKEKEELQETLKLQQSSEIDISATLDAETRAFIAPAVDQLLEQAHEVARCEAELARAKTLYSQAHAMNIIQNDLNRAQLDYTHLQDELEKTQRVNKERLEEFRQIFEHILRGVGFPDLKSCSIDDKKFMPYINENFYTTSIGAAYTNLIVVCYHLSLLELARREETFFPLLLVIDSPNVYDMNETSEYSLLHYLVKLAAENDDDKSKNWQIILTTRQVEKELDLFVKIRISKSDNQMLLRRK